MRYQEGVRRAGEGIRKVSGNRVSFDESITDAGFGADEPWVGRIVAQLGSQLVYVGAENVRVVRVFWSPDGAQDHGVSQYLTCIGNQILQEVVFRWGEANLLGVKRDDPALDIEREICDPDDRLLATVRRSAAQGYPDARQQFAHPKRLGEVVVRTFVERRDFRLLFADDGQDDDRRVMVAPELAADIDAAHVGQHEV